MNKKQKNMKKADKRLLVLVSLLGISVLLVTGTVIARYMMHQSKSGILSSEDFYFNSDLLKESGAEYFIDLQDGNFTLELYNFADSKRITSQDIKYSVSVQETGMAKVDPTEGTFREGIAETGIITVTPEASAKQITITARSITPYEKTLSATFYFQAGNSYTLENTAGDTAAVLTMICTDFSPSGKTVSLSLPEGIIPDATDKRVTVSGSNYTFTFPGNGVYSLVLLKSDASKSGKVTVNTIFTETIDLTGIINE